MIPATGAPLVLPASRPASRAARAGGQAGFTLIELLVVLVILGLLAALALYRLDTGAYPAGQQGLEALIKNPGNARGWKGPYLDSPGVPVDPWGNPYIYRAPGEHGAFDIYSLGTDRAPGGTGEASDVTSWGS
jgi:general secretion pathway protein G